MLDPSHKFNIVYTFSSLMDSTILNKEDHYSVLINIIIEILILSIFTNEVFIRQQKFWTKKKKKTHQFIKQVWFILVLVLNYTT